MATEINEIYLSAVIGRSVINSKGNELGILRDLIMIPGEVFPEVSHIVIKSRKGLKSLPWNEVSLFTHVVISIGGVQPHGLSPFEPYEGEILVKRDLLDKQIVDVDGAKVVRVNDIKLGNLNQKLCIFSVDIGFRGLLRRLGYERMGEAIAKGLGKEIHVWTVDRPAAAERLRSLGVDSIMTNRPGWLRQRLTNSPAS